MLWLQSLAGCRKQWHSSSAGCDGSPPGLAPLLSQAILRGHPRGEGSQWWWNFGEAAASSELKLQRPNQLRLHLQRPLRDVSCKIGCCGFLMFRRHPENKHNIYIHMHMHISWCAQRITNCANPGIWPKESFNRNISLAVQTDYVLYCIMIDAVTQRKRVTVQLSANPTMSAFPDAPPNPKHSGRFTTILLLDMWVTVIKAQNEAPRRTN